jgi:hypothetical protein
MVLGPKLNYIPSVTFISPLPAKWKVLRVICVLGSPTDCAARIPAVHSLSFKQCFGSMTSWCGSGSADPCL